MRIYLLLYKTLAEQEGMSAFDFSHLEILQLKDFLVA